MNIVSQDLSSRLQGDMQRIVEGRHHDPFGVLGYHRLAEGAYILVYMPHVRAVTLEATGEELDRVGKSDFFIWQGDGGQLSLPYRLKWTDEDGQQHRRHDPYACDKVLPEYDIDLFKAGKHKHAYRHLGAHLRQIGDVRGVLFATWAPNAERVSVVGDFNGWDGRVHPMRSRGYSGIWEIFIPDLEIGTLYKFELRNRDTGQLMLKADPYAQQFEVRPSTASMVTDPHVYQWGDGQWLEQRPHHDWQHTPLSVYEVHLGSWQRNEEGEFLNYRDIAHRLVDYCREMGFNALELLPVNEHPFDGSWGYQTLGYFAPTSRFGSPDDFRYFVDHCHQNGLRVFLDWVPGHFPKDAHGLARFDGTALYEHEDVRKGEHRDWGTLIFNYGRSEVKTFLIASAIYWLEEFHIDGLRVDAVASMLYLDYSREGGDWVPNIYGGNENLEAIEFLRDLNSATQGDYPGTLMVAEESTSWPQVTRPTWVGGLGFSMKWNMGWMHDTLIYVSKDPVYRHYYHDQLTFGLLYAFSENFVLPFSHDEVVHGKSSMLNKMPGDEWQRFANLRLLYTYMYTYPGKKLLFMGSEFGQGSEWTETRALDWYVLQYPLHEGVRTAVRDLNFLYLNEPALYRFDFTSHGFEWIDCHDAEQSVISYLRKGHDGEWMVIILNFTPVPRDKYLIGVPQGGVYTERFNSDSEYYGGSNLGNPPRIEATATSWMGRPYSIELTLPPLGGLILQRAHE